MLNQQTLDSPSFLAQSRQTLLREAAAVLLEPAGETAQYRIDAYPRLAAALASAIEQLRVAEEELAHREKAYRARDDEWRERLAYERLLFDATPALLLVTDTAGTILDANKALLDFLGCDAQRIDRMAFAEFVPREDRAAFRNGLTRLLALTRADDWRLRVVPRRNVPTEVSANVTVVPHANRASGTTALFWFLRRAA